MARKLIARASNDPARPLRVVDAGCGSQTYIRFGRPTHTVGVDVSTAQLDKRSDLVERIVGDIQDVDLGSGLYDAAICWDVLEHLPYPERTLRRLRDAVRPGGLLILGLPHVLSLKGVVTRLTPLRFHRWVYRTLLHSPRDPFPTYLRLSLRPRRLVRDAEHLGWNVAYARVYEGWTQREVRYQLGLTGWKWSVVKTTVRILSAGMIDAAATDVIVLMTKPAPPPKIVDSADAGIEAAGASRRADEDRGQTT